MSILNTYKQVMKVKEEDDDEFLNKWNPNNENFK